MTINILPKSDLKTRAFGEIIFELVGDPDSELAQYFSTLSVKFILENLDQENTDKFLKLLDKNQNLALGFASKKIVDFDNSLANYFKKHLEEIKSYFLP